MFAWRRNPVPTELLSEWKLKCPPRPARRPEEVAAFRERLLASLRVAHGLGVTLDLRLTARPDPVIALGCSTPAGARWITRVLSTAYGHTSWVRRPPTPFDPLAGVLWGRRVRAWPEPLHEAGDGPAALDCLRLAMRALTPGFSVRWVFSPSPATWRRPAGLAELRPGPRFLPQRRRPAEHSLPTRHFEALPAPVPLPLFWKSRACIAVPSEVLRLGSAEPVRSAIEAALRSANGNGVRFSRSRTHLPRSAPWFPVSDDELACILPGLDGGSNEMGSPESDSAQVLPLGRSVTGRVVGPPVEPEQGRHLTVLGETGMGKSSTLVAIAHKASALGGVVLFDPLGETARSFRNGLSIRERSRLVWVSPAEPACGINALEGIGPNEADPVLSDRRLNDIVHALRRVRSGRYADSGFWGPRLEEMLTRAIRAAGGFPGGTLADAHTLLETGARTHRVVPPSAQEDVRELADRIRARPDDAEGARRLLYEVVRSPVLRRMLCERTPTRHVRDLVEPGRIAVVAGDASEVGESVARYLLAVYLALVWSELLARRSLPKTFVVLDEAQWFSHESLAEMLRLARRKNVHVVLATQTVNSLPESVTDSVWTNVSDFVAFRGSPEEARELSRAAPGVAVEEVLALPRGRAAVLLGKGSSVDWLRTAGRPPSPSPDGEPDRPGVRVVARDLPGSKPPIDAPSATVEEVLGWIRVRAESQAPGEMIRVDLGEMRRTIDPGGRGVREAGARLGRAGALVSSERTAQGSVWVVDPTRIPVESTSRSPVSSSDGAEPPQPS